MSEFKDALNKPIAIGDVYGYSMRANGIVNVIIGEVTHFTPSKVALKVIKKGKAAYCGEIEFDKSLVGSKVSTISNTLFKIKLEVE